MDPSHYLLSLLGSLLLIGLVAVACGCLESRFARQATRAYRLGGSMRFPPHSRRKAFQWTSRSTLLLTLFVAIVLGTSLHGEWGNNLSIFTGILVGASIAALDYVGRQRIGPLSERPIMGAVGGMAGASVALLLPMGIRYIHFPIGATSLLLADDMPQRILWWLSTGAIVGSAGGFLAGSYRYRQCRIGRRAEPATGIPSDLPAARSRRFRFTMVAVPSIAASVLLFVATGAGLNSLGSEAWFGGGDLIGPNEYVVEQDTPSASGFQFEVELDDNIYCPLEDPNDRYELAWQYFNSSRVNEFLAESFNNQLEHATTNHELIDLDESGFGQLDEMRLPVVLTLEEIKRLREKATFVSIGCGPGGSSSYTHVTSLWDFEGPQDLMHDSWNGVAELRGPGFVYRRSGRIYRLIRFEPLSRRELNALEAGLRDLVVNHGLGDEDLCLSIHRERYSFFPTDAFERRFTDLGSLRFIGLMEHRKAKNSTRMRAALRKTGDGIEIDFEARCPDRDFGCRYVFERGHAVLIVSD